METQEIFWISIATRIEKEFGQGHPTTWGRSKGGLFLKAFKLRLAEFCNQDITKAEKCGLTGIESPFDHSQIQCSYHTLWRVLIKDGKNGNATTRNMFAIYFGYDSFEDYVIKNNLLDEKGSANKNEVSFKTVGEDLKDEKSKRNRKLIFWILFLIGCSVIAVVICKSIYSLPKKILIISSVKGLMKINPENNYCDILLEGENITGHIFDPKEGVLFYSITNHNFRTVGRASLNKRLMVENRIPRFTKRLGYPLGIALDSKNRKIFIADCGDLNTLGDGEIIVYDYNGKLLSPSLFPDLDMDPSSIIYDNKNKILYWTDPQNFRISKYDFMKKKVDINFLSDVGTGADGLTLDTLNNKLYWASNRDSLIGWTDLNIFPPISRLMKTNESIGALEYDHQAGRLYFNSHREVKIGWFELENNSLVLTKKGQRGITPCDQNQSVVKLYSFE